MSLMLKAIDGGASNRIIEVLSVLGAMEKTIPREVVRHTKKTGYMRVDSLWRSISRRVNGTTTGSMGLHVTKTCESFPGAEARAPGIHSSRDYFYLNGAMQPLDVVAPVQQYNA